MPSQAPFAKRHAASWRRSQRELRTFLAETEKKNVESQENPKPLPNRFISQCA